MQALPSFDLDDELPQEPYDRLTKVRKRTCKARQNEIEAQQAQRLVNTVYEQIINVIWSLPSRVHHLVEEKSFKEM